MKLIVILVSLVFVSGCLTTRSQVRSGQTPQPSQGAVLIEQGQQPAPSAKVSHAKEEYKQLTYDEQLRKLNGRIEVLEYQLRQKSASTGNATQLNQKLLAYEQALTELQQQIDVLKGQKQGAYLSSDEQAKRVPIIKKLNDFELAEKDFLAKKWQPAIAKYQSFRMKNKKSKLYPSATYKIGVCFQELGLNNEAKSFYSEVISKYAGTQEAKKASYRYKRLK